MTLNVCWSAKGGSGTTVVAAALAFGSATPAGTVERILATTISMSGSFAERPRTMSALAICAFEWRHEEVSGAKRSLVHESRASPEREPRMRTFRPGAALLPTQLSIGLGESQMNSRSWGN